MEVIVLIVGADEAFSHEAVPDYLVTDRAVATEEITVAVRGRRHGKVEADADKIPTSSQPGLSRLPFSANTPPP